MTLKKCTVTRLDDRFSRVEWDGPAARLGRDGRYANSPLIVEATRGYASPWHNYRRDTLDELLEDFGLTTEQPKPETAEERVRAEVEDIVGDGAYMGTEKAARVNICDLHDVLAELDRLREELEVSGASWHVLSKERDMLAAKLSEQRLVGVDAALAPIRGVVAQLWESAKRHESARLLEMDCGDRKEEAWHSARAVSYEAAARRVEAAIAEAEKIGRGE